MAEDVSTASYWSGRYRDDSAGWDLGGPCPVLVDLLNSSQAPPRGRVAFPGCGYGHDVLYWRERGYDALGFDFGVQPDDVPVEQLDVFELGARHREAFDVIVEYTCYCAIDPTRRREYVASLFDALRPGGLMVALLYPVEERRVEERRVEERNEGPPFGVDESEVGTVWGERLELICCETPTTSVEARLGKERLALLRKGEESE